MKKKTNRGSLKPLAHRESSKLNLRRLGAPSICLHCVRNQPASTFERWATHRSRLDGHPTCAIQEDNGRDSRTLPARSAFRAVVLVQHRWQRYLWSSLEELEERQWREALEASRLRPCVLSLKPPKRHRSRITSSMIGTTAGGHSRWAEDTSAPGADRCRAHWLHAINRMTTDIEAIATAVRSCGSRPGTSWSPTRRASRRCLLDLSSIGSSKHPVVIS